MSASMNEIFAQRLKNARLKAGLSMEALAEKLEHKITKQAIQKYEAGKMLPESALLPFLAQKLNIRIDEFFRPLKVSLGTVDFRIKASVSQKRKDQLILNVQDFLERYLELEELVGQPEIFVQPLQNKEVIHAETLGNLALEVRQNWELGLDPLPNILELLEEKGIKVIEIEGGNDFDGLATWVGEVPVIVVNRDLKTAERKRFTALHELGHLLLDFPADWSDKEIEPACHRFAAELLLPAPILKKELGEKRAQIAARELISIKEYYGISVQAIMRQALNHGIISDYHYQHFCRQIAPYRTDERGWGHFEGQEKSFRFDQLLHRAVAEEKITMSKAAELSKQTTAAFRSSFENNADSR
jgi:Zn-dependent peptidase ImmA (M78 family)/DNA-binding XRE family transcriptional regulator